MLGLYIHVSGSYLSYDHEHEIQIPQILMSASYIDIYQEIKDEDRSKSLYLNCTASKMTITLQLSTSHSFVALYPATSAYGVYRVYISIHTMNRDLAILTQGIWLLLMNKLVTTEFMTVRLKSSLRKFYGHHHYLVDR